MQVQLVPVLRVSSTLRVFGLMDASANISAWATRSSGRSSGAGCGGSRGIRAVVIRGVLLAADK